MIKGTKHIFQNPFFFLKKHCCPNCNAKMKAVKVSKVLNSNSPEARNYDFSLGDTYLSGDIKFIYKMLECPNCKTRFSAEELTKAKTAAK